MSHIQAMLMIDPVVVHISPYAIIIEVSLTFEDPEGNLIPEGQDRQKIYEILPEGDWP